MVTPQGTLEWKQGKEATQLSNSSNWPLAIWHPTTHRIVAHPNSSSTHPHLQLLTTPANVELLSLDAVPLLDYIVLGLLALHPDLERKRSRAYAESLKKDIAMVHDAVLGRSKGGSGRSAFSRRSFEAGVGDVGSDSDAFDDGHNGGHENRRGYSEFGGRNSGGISSSSGSSPPVEGWR